MPNTKLGVMNRAFVKRAGLLSTAALALAAALSAFFGVAYIYTFIGLSGWAFVGHLVTIDDDLPGGWSNPDGAHPSPWQPLAAKGAVFLVLGVIAIAFPGARGLGGLS